MTSRKVTVGQLRGPWVPAPAKASSAAALGVGAPKFSKGFILPLSFGIPSSSSSYNGYNPIKRQKPFTNTIGDNGGNRPKVKTKIPSGGSGSAALSNNPTQSQSRQRKDNKQVVIRKPRTRVKTKHGSKLTVSNLKLQSKDSLVDVTACLQAKRAGVMKIWDDLKSITKNDPGLLKQIEKANRLALEAAEIVEILRRTIQDFQKKVDGLNEEECDMLTNMRSLVLKKVREFEEADNELNDMIARKSASKVSLASAASKTSQTDVEPDEEEVVKSESKLELGQDTIPAKDLVTIKETPQFFPDSSPSESDDINVKESAVPPQIVKSKSNTQIEMPLTEKSVPSSVSASMENLNRLRLLYQENLVFPQINREEVILPRSRSCGNIGFSSKMEAFKIHHHQQERSVRFEERIYKSDSESHDIMENATVHSSSVSTSNDELYQQKISRLQRKLMETEQEVEELKSEIERIESDANFRVRMLQNSVQDKFDSLSVIPEYLQLLEFKINENSHMKAKLTQELQEKDRLLSVEKEMSAKLQKENDELKEKLKVSESTKELLTMKNYELEKNISQLRNEIDDMAKKYTDMAAILRENESFTSPRSPRKVTSSQQWEVQKLQLQCSEMKDRLSQSKRIIQTIRKSKEKMARGLNEKLEELMDALQEAQHHKRVLGDQIRFLKKSYHELFPPPAPPPGSSPPDDLFNFIMTEKIKPSTPKSSKPSKHHWNNEREPVIEPKFESTKTWQTGIGSYAESSKEPESRSFEESQKESIKSRVANNNTYSVDVTSSENDEV